MTEGAGGSEVPDEGDDPQRLGMDLLRQLGSLDDRLQRSQAQMLELLDRARTSNPVTPNGPADLVPDQRLRSETDAWTPPSGRPRSAPAFADGPFPWEMSETPPVVDAPTPEPSPEPTTSAARPPASTPGRPAWVSNLITGAVAVTVLFAALAFVGVF